MLDFLILIYIIFCLKRNGLHLLKVGWMVGLGLWFVSSMLMLAYYGNYYFDDYITFSNSFSWRGMCWIYASVVLVILGQEIICFITKGNDLPQKEIITKWKSYEWPHYYSWLIGLIGVYMLLCIVQYYKYVPEYMIFFRRPNLLEITTSDIPKVFHTTFFLGTSGLLCAIFLKSVTCKNWCVLCVTLLMLSVAILFCPLSSKTFLWSLLQIFPILPLCYYFLFAPQFKIRQICLAIGIVLFCVYLASLQRKTMHKYHISGFQRFSIGCASTLGCLKIKDKPKFGLFFTQRALKRLINKDSQLPSLGMYSFGFFNGKMLPIEELYVARKDKTSASINYIGQADLYFGWWGMCCFLLLGLTIGLLDYWYSRRIATISYSSYFCMFFILCKGSLASSMVESSIVKSSFFGILLLSIYEHVIRKKIVAKRK
ncbi:MAG: hypothetical protein LBD69_02030 [Puniceicoccales bacterium]|nr:hypothetical protein [Puniceicoccales bacterium]